MERDIRLYAALMAFQRTRLFSYAAAGMAGIARLVFLDVCADNGIAAFSVSPEILRRCALETQGAR